MNTYLLLLILMCFHSSLIVAQESTGSVTGKNLRIQKLVHDVIGETVTLKFKSQEQKTGTLISANGIEFVLEVEGNQEIFETHTIRSYTLEAGMGEGILVILSGCFGAGLGAGAAALSITGISTGAVGGVGLIFGILGGWLGYDSFYQDVEVELP